MLQFDFDVTAQQQINHDSYALMLQPKGKFLIRTPYGHHLSITAIVNYENITRSYTPVPVGYVPLDCTTCSIALLVKSYDCGLLSQQLTRPLPLNQSLRLSQPKGDFSLTKLKNHHRIALLAAGSGITPMFGLLDYLLLRSSNRV
jgi:cytochrome-b5 reductase